MPTAIKRSARSTKIDLKSTFKDHLDAKTIAAKFSARAEAGKKTLKEYLVAKSTGTYVDEASGHIYYDLDETVEVGGKSFKGFMLRRSVPVTFDEDVATKILKRKGVYEEALTPVVDQDKIARLHQEGKITDTDIDKMFVEGESYAFWPVEGEVL